MFLNTFEHWKNVKCGLLSFPPDSTGSDKDSPEMDPIPVQLLSVEVQATVVHAAAEVVVTQTYVNNQNEPIDTYFYFPLYKDDAVTGFEVEINDTLLKNLVVREESSQNAFDESVRTHPKRFLAKSNDPADVYQTRVGLLLPNAQLTLSIAYVTEVKLKGEKIQITIPNTVVPRFKSPVLTPPPVVVKPKRFIPPKDLEDDDVILIDSDEEEDEPEVEEEKIVKVDPGSVKINLQFLLEGEGSICSLESDTHVPQIAVIDSIADKPNWSTATVEFEGTFNDMDTDFSVGISLTDVLSPRMYVEETEDETILMSTFCPLLPLPHSSRPKFLLGFDSPSDGTSVDMAQHAVELLLNSLPARSEFNVIGAGVKFGEFLFSEFRVHNDDAVQEAQRIISSRSTTTTKSQGAASITTLLGKLYGQTKSSEFITQIILVLQKGMDKDEFQKCLGIVKRNTESHKSRLFVIGVGNNVDGNMLRKLATAGEGAPMLIPSNDSYWDPTLTSILDLCTSPSLTDVKLIWSDWDTRVKTPPANTLEDSEVMILDETAGAADMEPFVQIPDSPSPVFNATQLVTFGIFVHKFYPRILDVQGISYAKPSESLEYNYNIQLNESRDRHMGSNDTITKLAYAKAIRQLEEKMQQFTDGTRKTRAEAEKIKDRILQIATREGIPSKYTSFATVEVETGREVKGHWTRQTRYVKHIGTFSNNANSSASCSTWNSGIPSGSISRTKLNSIRNLTGLGPPLRKIPRTATLNVVTTDSVAVHGDNKFSLSVGPPEVITIGD